MDTTVRFTPLLHDRERARQSSWSLLRYFNTYRICIAGVFLGIVAGYGDTLSLGAHRLDLFRSVAGAYFVLAILTHFLVSKMRLHFSMQLSWQVLLDVVSITLLMYASGGMRSGLGAMLLITVTGAAILAPARQLIYFYAALAAIALLLEQGYWVLAHEALVASFFQPALLATGCFATAAMTAWLARRLAANESLARQRGRELKTQTMVNQLVIRDMQDGVVVLDRYGHVVQHNPQAGRLLGHDRLLGVDLAMVLPGFAGRWHAWRESHGSLTTAADAELRGRDIRLRFLDAGTEEEFSVLFIEDTTRAREQAQQLKLAALGRLTANIAHEIRNPLAAISHASELLGEEKRAEDRARLTRIIHDNTRRLERLVSDVMQLNRRDRISAQRLALEAWLPAFLDEFVANEALPRERFVVSADRGAAVLFDPEQLRQVMWNLLRNAVRYAGEAPASVRVHAGRFADQVELSVIDNGPGVPVSNQAQLFEPFFTTDSKGTGLGLYLARELCAANRAVLEYVNDMPGAHFRILCRHAS
jgi:two-component system sensor histidine kinase PilS (NtrC family)